MYNTLSLRAPETVTIIREESFFQNAVMSSVTHVTKHFLFNITLGLKGYMYNSRSNDCFVTKNNQQSK